MRGRFITLCLAVEALLAGCAPMHVMGRATSPVPAGSGMIQRIAQTLPAVGRVTVAPPFVLCGSGVPCPEPTRKTLDTAVAQQAATAIQALPTAPAQPLESAVKRAPMARSATVRFAFASASLSAGDLTPLQAVMEDMRSAERIMLRGRTDDVGGKPDNDRLALRRAEAVREYLIGHGVDAGRIGIEAAGKCCYVASNRTPEGRSANRRVEVVITIVMKE